MDRIEEIFDGLINEISTGVVMVNGISRYMKFNFFCNNKEDIVNNIHDFMLPTLTITKKDEFLLLLIEYFEVVRKFKEINDDEIKDNLVYLFSIATMTDFNNPYKFLIKIINFYLTDKIKHEGKKLGDIGSTPYQIELFLDNIISYGIDNDVCYIYDISSDDILNSVVIFLDILKKSGINKIKLVHYIPYIHIMSMDISNDYKSKLNTDEFSEYLDKEETLLKEKFEKRKDKLFEILDLFNFRGYIKILSDPSYTDEFMCIDISKFNKEILDDFIYKLT